MLQSCFDIFQPYIQSMTNGDSVPLTNLIERWHTYQLNKKDRTHELEFLDSITNIEPLLEQLIEEPNISNVGILAILTGVFGLCIPFKLREINGLDYLTTILAEISQHKYCQYLFGMFQGLRFREACFRDMSLFFTLMEKWRPNKDYNSFRMFLFDRKYVDIQIAIKLHEEQPCPKLFLQIQELYQQLKSTSQLKFHDQMLGTIVKFIKHHQDTLAQQEKTQETNAYYASIETLQNIRVITNQEELLERELFIHNESTNVQESQTLEYKELYNLKDPKRQFIVKKAITSFLNAEGGSLFIGIHDQLYVKGFSVGEKEDQIREILEQDCISNIHPKLVENRNYRIQFIPIRDHNGELLRGQKIIKITVCRDMNCTEMYSFNEFHPDYQIECNFCFWRSNDSSRVMRPHQMKQFILSRQKFLEEPQRIFKTEYLPTAQQRPDPSEIQNRKIKSPALEINREENASTSSDDQANSLGRKILVLRRFKKETQLPIISILNQIQKTTQYIKSIKQIGSTIIIELQGDYRIELLEQFQQLAKDKSDIQFQIGHPQYLQIKNWLPQLTQDQITKKQIAISSALNLNNFKMIPKVQHCSLQAKFLDDLIPIYAFLKDQNLEVHWKLELVESKNYKNDVI